MHYKQLPSIKSFEQMGYWMMLAHRKLLGVSISENKGNFIHKREKEKETKAEKRNGCTKNVGTNICCAMNMVQRSNGRWPPICCWAMKLNIIVTFICLYTSETAVRSCSFSSGTCNWIYTHHRAKVKRNGKNNGKKSYRNRKKHKL